MVYKPSVADFLILSYLALNRILRHCYENRFSNSWIIKMRHGWHQMLIFIVVIFSPKSLKILFTIFFFHTRKYEPFYVGSPLRLFFGSIWIRHVCEYIFAFGKTNPFLRVSMFKKISCALLQSTLADTYKHSHDDCHVHYTKGRVAFKF